MSIDFIHLKELLLDKVGCQLAQYGFTRGRRSQEFSKPTHFGRHGFHLSFIKHEEDFDITVDVGVRYDSLEDLVNEKKSFLSAAQQKKTYSLGADLGNITGEGDKRWTIAGSTDIDSVTESLVEAFKSVAIPYLEAFSDPETALKALSADDATAWLHSPVPSERAMRAIGLAFLLADAERFSEISTAQTQFLTSRKDPDLPVFRELVADLERRLGELK